MLSRSAATRALDLRLGLKTRTDGSFGSTVGQFCLLAGLRAQVAPGRDAEFKQVSQER